MAADFTPTERETISSGFFYTVLGMLAVEPGGLDQEYPAMLSALNTAAQQHGDNPLIQQVMEHRADVRKDWLKELLSQHSKEDLRSRALASCTSIATLLESKVAAAVATEYKQALYSVIDTVANAAGEKGFIGTDGEQISTSEAAFMDDVKAALKL